MDNVDNFGADVDNVDNYVDNVDKSRSDVDNSELCTQFGSSSQILCTQ